MQDDGLNGEGMVLVRKQDGCGRTPAAGLPPLKRGCREGAVAEAEEQVHI